MPLTEESTTQVKEEWVNAYKPGQILVKSWGKSKSVKHRTVKVIRVYRYSRGKGQFQQVYYTYDLQHSDGGMEKKCSSSQYISFEKHRKYIQDNIHRTNKILEAQEKEYQHTFVLETEAKKAFHQDVGM